MSALEIQVYEIFKSKLGEAEVSKVIEYIDKKAEEKINQKKDVFLTKDDKVDLIKEIAESKAELIKWSFVFWVGTVITILGGLLAILKLFFNK